MTLLQNYSLNKEYLKARGFLYNEYEGQAFRPLTFAERKVNWVWMRGKMKKLWTDLQAKISPFIPKIAQNTFTKKDFDKMVYDVTETQKESFWYGKQTASSEMDVRVKPTNPKVYDAMEEQNAIIIGKMISDINKKIWKFTDEGIISQFFNGLNTLYVSGGINLGRQTVFEYNKDMVYAFQYSAILDGRTTDICKSLDGTTVDPESQKARAITPPNHRWCRSVRVEILEDETYKPAISVSIPQVDLSNKIDFGGYLRNIAKKVAAEELTKEQIKEELKTLEKQI